MLKILLLCAGAGAFAPPPQLRHHRCAAPRRNKHHRCAPRRGVAEPGGEPETKITSDYVATLFDSFAENFEEVLESLDYCAPKFVGDAVAALAASRAEPYGACLDAGCGTGLAAHGLRPHVAALYGVDLSPDMARLAEELCYEDGPENPPSRSEAAARRAMGWPRLYDGVSVGNLLDLSSVDGLPRRRPRRGRQLCYFGDLEPVVAGLAARLAPGGDLVFSVETLPEGDYAWVLQCQERYAHDDAVARHARASASSSTRFQPRTESGARPRHARAQAETTASARALCPGTP
ncbi:methyltransferase [Aureococcus anophagefferens]|nr:methyltransferase [Aureococcus anophagefferens]